MRAWVLLLVASVAAAAPSKSADGFAGYGGLRLRDNPKKIKQFGKAWRPVDNDSSSHRYVLRKVQPFAGTKVDEAVAVVSRHLGVVVRFALKLSGDHCDAIEKALDGAWGEPRAGTKHGLDWSGAHVAARLEHQGDVCLVFVGDAAWDELKDDYRP